MSLINKMLQDLDARGSTPGGDLPPEIRAAAVPEHRARRKQVIIGASVLTIAIAVAAVIWIKLPAGESGLPVKDTVAVLTAPPGQPAAVPVSKLPPPAPVGVVLPQPVAAPVPAAASAAAAAAPAPAAAPVAAARTPAVPAPASARPAPAASPAFDAAQASEQPVAVVPKPAARALRPMAQPAPRVVQTAPTAPASAPVPATTGREVTVPQRAENAYRQALTALEQGKVTTAYVALEQALKLNPRHDAARQSMVSLLIEDGRNDEAMQQLEQGLVADSAQPALAMLLARMQIERGVSGVPTLLRTLPAAAGNADYRAFLAGALQREQRHREAVEQYAAALQITPEQGVWLMGMGISLQAEKRPREAVAAFQRARASGMLTQPLDTFVERRLQQLAQ